MHTTHSRLLRFMRLAAVAGIVAFLSFPAGPSVRVGSGVARWLNAVASYVR
jgi:hypothetical protein